MLRTIANAPAPAKLTAVADNWLLRFERNNREFTVPAADVVSWGQFVEPRGGLLVLLADEGEIVVESAELHDEKLVAKSAVFGEVRLPIEIVRGIIVSLPSAIGDRDRLADSLRTARGEEDRLILTNGDIVRGSIAELTSEHCQVQAGETKTKLELRRIQAIVFDPGLLQAPQSSGLRVLLGFTCGSRILAASVRASDQALVIRGSGKFGAELSAVAAVQPIGGRVTYLSDLPVSSYRHVPYLSLSWSYRHNRSVVDTMLRAGGQLYLKGIGMHSAARLTYDLEKSYKRLEGYAAIDDAAGSGGSVVMRVLGDTGDGVWKALYTSPAIRGASPAVPLRVDVSGVKRLSLVTDFGERGDQLDYADWLGLHLVE